MDIVHVHITDFDGTTHTLDGIAGWRLMEVIRDYGLPIKAECGGACACATCHVFVEGAWAAKTGARTQQEDDMLNFAAELRESSRLACQITVTDDLDGLDNALANLPEPSRALLRYSAVDGWSIDRIGALYGIHRSSASRSAVSVTPRTPPG